MSISLKKSGMLKLGLSLVALTVAASVQAKTLVYCSEGSPEGFNPQLFTSGTTYDASSVPIYNRYYGSYSGAGGKMGSERGRQNLYIPPASGREVAG